MAFDNKIDRMIFVYDDLSFPSADLNDRGIVLC